MRTLHIGAIAALTILSTSLAAAAAPAPVGPSVRLIYRCEQGGVMIFSDQPCSSRAQTYEADTSRVSIYQGTPVQRVERREPARAGNRAASSRRGSIAADQARHAAGCAKVTDALREVRAKMRSGYNAKEGEQLKARQVKLTDRARRERCR